MGLEKAVYHFPSYPRLCVTVKVFVEVPSSLQHEALRSSKRVLIKLNRNGKTNYFKVQMLGVFAFRKGREKETVVE